MYWGDVRRRDLHLQLSLRPVRADPRLRLARRGRRGQGEGASQVLADVRSRRARNLTVLLTLVDLAADGVLDALLIGQDDAAEYGWTRRDLRAVTRRFASAAPAGGRG